MLPVLDIIVYSLSPLLLSALFLVIRKIKIVKPEWIVLIGGGLILTALSFSIYKERIGGTIMHWAHGWPHFFANYQIKDILDNVIINKWHFTPGGMYSYIIADWVFYFSVLLFLYILFKIIIKKNI